MTNKQVITRFAPSPSGYLHLGHAYSALLAQRFAAAHNGDLLLRFEDIDLARCKSRFEAAIIEDLEWLGIGWSAPTIRQSERFDTYERVLAGLEDAGLIYPCFCTRAQIAAEIQASVTAPHDMTGTQYPGTCRMLGHRETSERKKSGEPFARRLNLVEAISMLQGSGLWPLEITNNDGSRTTVDPTPFGDVVLARKDVPTSYHLAVVIDDSAQRVTHIVRGKDLMEATHIHRVLQALLGYNPIGYMHHELLRDAAGRRYAKRDHSLTLRSLRERGMAGQEIRDLLLSPDPASAISGLINTV